MNSHELQAKAIEWYLERVNEKRKEAKCGTSNGKSEEWNERTKTKKELEQNKTKPKTHEQNSQQRQIVNKTTYMLVIERHARNEYTKE